MIKKEKEKTTYGMGKVFANDATNKGLNKIYKQILELNKKQRPQMKMGRRSLYTFPQRIHTDSQQAHEKMFMTNYQGNVNQNYNETSPQTCQNSQH